MQNDNYMTPEKKAFYKWSAHTMEPWYGPGKKLSVMALAFIKGVQNFPEGFI